MARDHATPEQVVTACRAARSSVIAPLCTSTTLPAVVDEHGRRHLEAAEPGRAAPPPVGEGRVGDAGRATVARASSAEFLVGHADDRDLVAEALVDPLECRHLVDAGRAPRGEEVEDDGLGADAARPACGRSPPSSERRQPHVGVGPSTAAGPSGLEVDVVGPASPVAPGPPRSSTVSVDHGRDQGQRRPTTPRAGGEAPEATTRRYRSTGSGGTGPPCRSRAGAPPPRRPRMDLCSAFAAVPVTAPVGAASGAGCRVSYPPPVSSFPLLRCDAPRPGGGRGCGMSGSWSSGRGSFGRPAPTPLGGQDLPVQEELAAPHAPRLTPLQGTLEAGDHRRAGGADVLGPGDVLQLLAEEHRGEPAAAVVAAGVGPPGVLVARSSGSGSSASLAPGSSGLVRSRISSDSATVGAIICPFPSCRWSVLSWSCRLSGVGPSVSAGPRGKQERPPGESRRPLEVCASAPDRSGEALQRPSGGSIGGEHGGPCLPIRRSSHGLAWAGAAMTAAHGGGGGAHTEARGTGGYEATAMHGAGASSVLFRPLVPLEGRWVDVPAG